MNPAMPVPGPGAKSDILVFDLPFLLFVLLLLFVSGRTTQLVFFLRFRRELHPLPMLSRLWEAPGGQTNIKTRVADVWLGFNIFLMNIRVFSICSWGASGWLLGGRLGVGNTPQDHSFYFTKSQPDRLHLTPIREGFWFGSWALNLHLFIV
jgi:hypothetical protein